MNAKILHNMPEAIGEAGQSRGLGLQLAHEHLRGAPLHECLKRSNFEAVVGSSEEKQSAYGKASANSGIKIRDTLRRQTFNNCVSANNHLENLVKT